VLAGSIPVIGVRSLVNPVPNSVKAVRNSVEADLNCLNAALNSVEAVLNCLNAVLNSVEAVRNSDEAVPNSVEAAPSSVEAVRNSVHEDRNSVRAVLMWDEQDRISVNATRKADMRDLDDTIQTANRPHLPADVRNEALGRWPRHRNRAGTPGPQRHQDQHDLHSCPGPRRQGCSESGGWSVEESRRCLIRKPHIPRVHCGTCHETRKILALRGTHRRGLMAAMSRAKGVMKKPDNHCYAFEEELR